MKINWYAGCLLTISGLAGNITSQAYKPINDGMLGIIHPSKRKSTAVGFEQSVHRPSHPRQGPPMSFHCLIIDFDKGNMFKTSCLVY